MTEYIFHLSGDNIQLARYETVFMTGALDYSFDGDLLMVGLKGVKGLDKRLGFTHSIHKLLFVCDKQSVDDAIKKFDWNKIIKADYKVFLNGDLRSSERELAGFVWDRLKNPKVNLKKPKHKVIFFVRGKVYACLHLADADKSYNARCMHMLPGRHPSVMKPRLAKAVVNLLAAKNRSIIYDPFCGTCGLLIEAALMGYKVIGSDNDELMIEKAKSNFAHLKINNFKLYRRDALMFNKKADYVVTDLPYAKGTKNQDIIKLYTRFLKILDKLLVSRAVVIFPSTVNAKYLISKTNLRVLGKFDYYLHKSLSKQIFVLGK